MSATRGPAGYIGLRSEIVGPHLDVAALMRVVDAERLRRERNERPDIHGHRRRYPWARVARESGISEATMNQLPAAARAPSADTLVRLLVWLGSYDLRPFIASGQDSAPPATSPVERGPAHDPPPSPS
jgi:hypothetical protein